MILWTKYLQPLNWFEFFMKIIGILPSDCLSPKFRFLSGKNAQKMSVLRRANENNWLTSVLLLTHRWWLIYNFHRRPNPSVITHSPFNSRFVNQWFVSILLPLHQDDCLTMTSSALNTIFNYYTLHLCHFFLSKSNFHASDDINGWKKKPIDEEFSRVFFMVFYMGA